MQWDVLRKSEGNRDFTIPWMDLSHDLCTTYVKGKYVEGGVTVQDGYADLEFDNLAIEVSRLLPLPQKLHAMHLCFDAILEVIFVYQHSGTCSGHTVDLNALADMRMMASA